jgi:peptidoglycan/LPS O-acetylase OafA/YrhL
VAYPGGGLDILRLISVALVMYGHFVSVGGGAKIIPGIFSESVTLPLIDASKWHAYKFDIFLINNFHTQSGILGVTLFFLVTGYLMPIMLERYSRKEFLINRFFRIFPTLFVSLLAVGYFTFLMQGLIFPLSEYIASLTLSFMWTKNNIFMGVLWTLSVEFIFYLICFSMGKFTNIKLFLSQVFLLLCCFFAGYFPNNFYVQTLGYHSIYLSIICIGSTFYLSNKSFYNYFIKFLLILYSILICLFGFYLYKIGNIYEPNYQHPGTLLLASALFTISLTIFNTDKLKIPYIVSLLANLVYPIYLIHVAFGLLSIFFFRSYIDNPYILVMIAVVISLLIAAILHISIEAPFINYARKIIKSSKISALQK